MSPTTDVVSHHSMGKTVGLVGNGSKRSKRRTDLNAPFKMKLPLVLFVVVTTCVGQIYVMSRLFRVYPLVPSDEEFDGAAWDQRLSGGAIDATTYRLYRNPSVQHVPGRYSRVHALFPRTPSPVVSNRTVFVEPQSIFFAEYPPSYPEPRLVGGEGCVPMAEWQTATFPTCNTLHEHNMAQRRIILLGRGGVRNVWRFDTPKGDPDVVFKTLRYHLDYNALTFESQNKDALAMERLTSSPHVVGIHGFCGQSVINEMISGKSLHKKLKYTHVTSRQKLQYARDAAEALADVHSIDKDANGNDRITLVHRDVSEPNLVLSLDHKRLLINDFNSARFLYWNATSDSPCGFSRPECNTYRSPEECLGGRLSEKIDVYALGNVLYKIMTEIEPYTFPRQFTTDEKFKMITHQKFPPLPPKYGRTRRREIVAIFKAIKKCFLWDPEERPSAKQIADELNRAIRTMDWYESENDV